jgi:hypothetical protein
MFWTHWYFDVYQRAPNCWDPKKVFGVFRCGTELMGATYQQENTEGVCCGSFRGFGVDDEMSIWLWRLWLKPLKLDGLMVPVTFRIPSPSPLLHALQRS